MRRPLLLLAMSATILASHPAPALSRVWPTSPPTASHASRAQKLARQVVAYARRQVGVSYSWGGASPNTGFDCSGLVYAAYRSVGREIPRSSWDQLRVGRPIRFAPASARRPALHRGRRPCSARRLEEGRDLCATDGRARPLRPVGTAPPGVRRRRAPAQIGRRVRSWQHYAREPPACTSGVLDRIRVFDAPAEHFQPCEAEASAPTEALQLPGTSRPEGPAGARSPLESRCSHLA